MTISVKQNPRKILIVDDEQDITSSFDMILHMNGFEVDAYYINEVSEIYRHIEAHVDYAFNSTIFIIEADIEEKIVI